MEQRDRLREVVDSIVDALDEPADGRSMAGRALLSRFHFDRVVAAGLGETPTALRRRLLLERAAWQLRGGQPVTDTAWSAGFESLEGFSRAFARVHGVPPSRFASGDADFRIAAANGVHFHPPANLAVRATGSHDARGASPPGGWAGTPLAILVEHDRSMTDALVDAAAALGPASLDAEMRPGHAVLEFDGPETTLRSMLDRLVWTKEVWTAAIEGRSFPGVGRRSPAELRRRSQDAGARFAAVVADLEAEHRWADAFVDTLCDPPQAFTYGAVVAHVLTFAAHRRQVAVAVLGELGAPPPAVPSCPIEWQRAALAPLPLDPDALRGGPPA